MTRRKIRAKPEDAARTLEVTVDTLGAQGDGVARDGETVIHIPLTLPGDRVTARVRNGRGTVLEFSRKAPRSAPPCPYFGECGGCKLQHLPRADYIAFKRRRVTAALGRKGFTDPPVDAPQLSPLASRRRAVFSFVRGKAGVAMGFHAPRQHRIVDIGPCPVLQPPLEGLISPLRAMLNGLSLRRGKVMVTHTETGPDMMIAGETPLTLADREVLAAFAADEDLARIAFLEAADVDGAAPETVVRHRMPQLTFGNVPVALPPGAFVQATAAGEAALLACVREWAKGPRVLDLFAGGGALSLPLAGQWRVHAVDDAPEMLAAMAAAAASAGIRTVTTQVRDLHADPLVPAALQGVDTVIFDPPRAGAKAQAENLVQAAVPRIIAVSCNPATFARDARILADGGYDLIAVRPVDQFLFSPHVELAALFTRSADGG